MGSAPAPDRFLIALAALDLLSEAAAEAPLLALVEDAHWLDRASADVLAFAARRLEPDPIVMVAALRDGFDSPLAAAGLQELAPSGSARRRRGAARRARSAARRAMRERILREADGNPLALVELPVAIERLGDRVLPPADLPLTDRLEHAFAARSAELPEPTRALLLIAALEDGGSLETVLDAGARMDAELDARRPRAGGRGRAGRDGRGPGRASATRSCAPRSAAPPGPVARQSRPCRAGARRSRASPSGRSGIAPRRVVGPDETRRGRARGHRGRGRAPRRAGDRRRRAGAGRRADHRPAAARAAAARGGRARLRARPPPARRAPAVRGGACTSSPRSSARG